jgi:O-antigen/teichoic acid export membrane protein
MTLRRAIRQRLTPIIRGISLLLGRQGVAREAEVRSLSILRGGSSALAARGVGIAVGLISVPLMVRHLGAERYGACVTVSSTMIWWLLADLGFGSELTNALAEGFGRRTPELARQQLATAFWALTLIALSLGAAFFVVWPRVDWAALLNVHSPLARAEVGGVVAVAVLFFLMGLPLTVVDRVYAAYQEGATGNLWSVAATLAALAALVGAVRTTGGMVALVLAVGGTRLTVQIVSAIWLFEKRHPELRPGLSAVRRESLRRLSRTGGLFFVVQLAALVLFNTDNVIIAHVLGAADVTPYSISWTLFTLPSMGFSLVFPYLWPAYAEALHRNDVEWVRRTFRLSVILSVTSALIVALPLVVFGRPLVKAWAGNDAVPATSLLLWMGGWSLIYAAMNPIACFLNAGGHLKRQAISGSLAALVNVILSIVWARRFGPSGVMAATVVSFLAISALPVCLQARSELSRLESAIES